MGAMCVTRMGEYFSEEDRKLAEAYAAFASSVLHSAQISPRFAEGNR